MSQFAAIDYLRSPPGEMWKWEEGGRVLTWGDGTTVLFREELEAIVERLAPTGLPPFSALVLLFAACRGQVPAVAPLNQAAGPDQGRLLRALRLREHHLAATELMRVSRLPPELIARASGKALLAEAVFELTTRLSTAETAAVVRGLPEAWGDAELNRVPADTTPVDLSRMLQLVFEGVRRHSTESLLRRLQTGLDALPEATLEIELPREERSRRLFDALGKDDELAGLATVVRDLMAALRLPRSLAHPDESAAEGVADIGNRGPLDRLVLSELAHDDLTLATRVALNEALYLRREPPAQRPRRALAVLLDSGVRMWGVPRVLGTAAALALVSRHPAGCVALAWRADGRALVPVDLLEKDGLESHLAALVTDLHPGAALPAFVAALAEHPDVDAVIVVHRDTLADPTFQAQLARTAFDRGFLLLVERDGLVQLHPLPWGSPRPLAQVQVEVAKLFPRPQGRPGSAPLVDEAQTGDWPAIFRERPFPLLLPVNAKMEHVVPSGEGGLCVTADRRLLHWSKREKGARQVATDLPSGRTCWLNFDPVTGRTVMVRGRGSDGRMTVAIAGRDGGDPTLARFTGPHHPLAVWIDRQVLLIALHTRIVAVALANGEVLAETPLAEGVKWINGCYYSGPRGLCFASWNGLGTGWDTLAVGQHTPAAEVLTVFDREGIGAWVVLRDGRLLSPTGSEVLHTGFALDAAQVSDGGDRVAVRRAGREEWHAMDLGRKAVVSVPDAASVMARPPVPPPTRNLQHQFYSIWAAPGQPLRLRKTGRKAGKWLEIFLNPGGALQLVESIETDATLQADAQIFSPVSTPPRLGCSLKVARWPGGNCAWLDSRGLLHLRSPRPTMELTLALSYQCALAGWSTTSARCGPAFFHCDGVTEDVKRFHELLAAFCRSVC